MALVQVTASLAHGTVGFAAKGVVADARSRPQVVHGPHHRLAAGKNLANRTQRQQPLIDPRQMDDVGLLKLGKTRDVDADIGQVELKELLPAEMKMPEQAPTLPKEVPPSEPRTGRLHHGDVVGHLVAHKHLGLHAIIVERVEQAAGGQGGPTCLLTCVDNQYAHTCMDVFCRDSANGNNGNLPQMTGRNQSNAKIIKSDETIRRIAEK